MQTVWKFLSGQTIQFTQHQSAGATIAAIAYAPDGVIFKNDEVKTLRAHCDLWRGATIDTTNVTYCWGIKNNRSVRSNHS